MGGPIYGEKVNWIEERHCKTETMDNEIHELMIEWSRACWKARNGIIYGERHQCYTMERKRLQAEASVYMNALKEVALVPIEHSRATRKNVRNLPIVEIANWIAEQCQQRQRYDRRRVPTLLS